MDKVYDVIVVGGGPAGGQTARELAEKGNKVLLVERYKSFAENNFSTAGMTLKPVEEFNLPESVIGAYWNDFVIQCSKNEYRWKSDKPIGAILEFGKLRQFLADETIKHGSDVLLGHKYVSKRIHENGVEADFINIDTDETITLKSKLIVDATGPHRRVMYNSVEEQPEMMSATGIEYLIKVDQDVYDRYKDALVTFMGDKWALKGYSWICPMENRILKVGSGKLNLDPYQREVEDTSIKQLCLDIIHDYMKAENYQVLDVHGGPLRFSTRMEDKFYENRVIAVGDCVSTVNPLGGEGIRYAMISASLAAKYIDIFLKTGKNKFKSYERSWKKQYALKWRFSELVARKVYLKYSDEDIEKRTAFVNKRFDTDKIIDILFYFKFHRLWSRFFDLAAFKLTGRL